MTATLDAAELVPAALVNFRDNDAAPGTFRRWIHPELLEKALPLDQVASTTIVPRGWSMAEHSVGASEQDKMQHKLQRERAAASLAAKILN
eukprot:SAG31_NODE_5323_length_2609_cov_3.546215_4_plen_91_part_00